MQRQRTFFLALLLSLSSLQARADSSPQTQQIVMAVVQTLDFNEGDAGSLMNAEEQFTPSGWKEFLASMHDFVDAKGAPTFSSSFSPSGDAVVTGQSGGRLHLMVPGILKQQHGVSTTTYTVEVDIDAIGSPMRIDHLKQKMVPKAGGGTR